MNRRLALLSWVLALSLSAVAAQGQFYLGLTAGGVEYDQEQVDWTPSVLSRSLTRPADVSSETSKPYFGYRLNKHLAVEGGYTDLGQVVYSQSTITLGRPIDFFNSTDVKGPVVTAVGILPFKIRKVEFEAFAKLGAFYWRADSHASRTTGIGQSDSPGTSSVSVVEINDTASGFSPVFGVGLEFNAYRGLAFRAEIELFGAIGGGRRQVDVDPGNRDSRLRFGLDTPAATVSLGLRYRFGKL